MIKKHPFLLELTTCLEKIDSNKFVLYNINNREIFDICYKLYYIEDTTLTKLILGEITLDIIDAKKNEVDFLKKKENCDFTIKQILSLEIAIKKLAMLGLEDTLQFQELLSELKAEVNCNQKLLIKFLIKEKEIKKIVNNDDTYNIVKYNSSTLILDFEKRSKFQITPDFGWIGYGFQEDFYGFSPYLGFHINFRYINKNIPFSKLPNKTCFHYLSFMTAWSLTSISEEGKRKDFFSNSTLLTGLGIRLNNSLRITGGVNWFYMIDPNPLINEKSIAVTPYVGLSIDLDVKQFLNGFADLKPQK